MEVAIFGPPGTGKTYTLRQIVGHMVGDLDATQLLEQYDLNLPRRAYSLKDFAFMSHTNSAVDELIGRLGHKRTYQNGLWGTMHGIALHLLIERGAVARKVVHNTLRRPGAVNWWKRKFAYEVGIPYDPDEELSVLEGNQFFQAYSRAVNVYFPETHSLGGVLDRLARENEYFADLGARWLKFKRKHKIFDFDDILALALLLEVVPEEPVLVADEFQDFSPLQWAIFKNWMVDKEYVIIAGDDDQVVGAYSGASPRFMLEFAKGADKAIVLRKSHRLPAQILYPAKKFIELFVTNRWRKEFAPNGDSGKLLVRDIPLVSLPHNARYLAEKGYTVLIEARTNALVKAIEEYFIQAHVPYYRFKTRKVQIWKDFVDRIWGFVEALRAGEQVTVSDARFYLKMARVPPGKVGEIAKLIAQNPRNLIAQKIMREPLKFISEAKVADFFGSVSTARVAMDALKARFSGAVGDLKGKIIIDTIHASKGREADVVFLVDTISNRIVREMEEGGREEFENEVRVWYVGMTRARKALVLVRGAIPFVTPKLYQIARMVKARQR